MQKLLPLLAVLAAPTLVSAAPATAPATAKTAAKTKIDPAALRLFDRSVKAYSALKGLSMTLHVSTVADNKPSKLDAKFAFSRPGSARLEFTEEGKHQLFVAGKGRIYAVKEPKSYQSGYLLDEDPIEFVAQRLPSALNIPFIDMIAGDNPLEVENQLNWQSRLLPGNGVELNSNLPQGAPTLKLKVFFNKSNALINRVEIVMTHQGKTRRETTTISDLKINPRFAPATFNFKPARGATEVAIPPLYDPKIKVGVKPYALVGTDLTKYRGKVVLLDFWATWCGPCVAEMPNVQRAYNKYHGKGFEIIGVSLDQEKAELDAYVRKNKIPWTQLFDGKGFENVNANRYKVTAIPFSLLLGKDGTIVAVNPTGKKLGPAIEKSLNS